MGSNSFRNIHFLPLVAYVVYRFVATQRIHDNSRRNYRQNWKYFSKMFLVSRFNAYTCLTLNCNFYNPMSIENFQFERLISDILCLIRLLVQMNLQPKVWNPILVTKLEKIKLVIYLFCLLSTGFEYFHELPWFSILSDFYKFVSCILHHWLPWTSFFCLFWSFWMEMNLKHHFDQTSESLK